MSRDTASIAPSEATTLYDDPQQRTTLLGKPIEHKHDNLSNIMLGDGGGFASGGSVGANLLPPGYTDKSLVRIPIRMSDVKPNENPQPAKKKSFFHRNSSATQDEIKVVMMSRGDYLKYWLKGDDGKFAPSVVEPPEGREQWYENQLKINEEWIKNDPSLSSKSKKSDRGFPVANLGDAVAGLG